MNPSKPVLIMGSGISGLTLAHALKGHGIPFRVYERDAASDQRAQGYRIRINQHGLDALRKCVPEAVYKRFEETTAENLPMGGARLGTKPGAGPGPGGPPRGPPGQGGQAPRQRPPPMFSLPADRRLMRSVLLSGLEDSVFYGKAFADYTISPTGVVAHFADGTSSPEASLIVGADGGHSKVARKLANDLLRPKPLGSWMIFGKTFAPPELMERLSPELTGGMKLLIDESGEGDQPLLFSEPMRFRHTDAPPNYIYWVMLGDEGKLGLTTEQLGNLSPQAAADASIRATQGWAPDVRLVLEEQDAQYTSVLRMATTDPNGVPAWPTSERVTLIGDAVHCMPPAGGVGANTALRDAALLSDKLKAGMGADGWTKDVIGEYEREMREYASELVATSYGTALGPFGARPIAS